jgi:hypothetical protein
MRQFLRDNGLSLTLLALFLVSFIGQALTGWRANAEELRLHELPEIGFLTYLTSGHFISATFENWESEFLQMAAYVLLTVFLFQKGSPESKKPDQDNPEDEPPAQAAWRTGRTRAGPSGWPAAETVLALAQPRPRDVVPSVLLAFWLHLAGSTRRSNEEALQHHQPLKTMTEMLGEPEFWYESFQNWQSEFLSIAVLLVLGIYLRERGSPESKPVAAPHAMTGH